MNEWELWLWFLENNPFYKWMFIAVMLVCLFWTILEILGSLKDDNKIKITAKRIIISSIDYILEVLNHEENKNDVRNRHK